MSTPAERALNLTEEYLAAKNDRDIGDKMFGGTNRYASREPALIAAEWALAMREALGGG